MFEQTLKAWIGVEAGNAQRGEGQHLDEALKENRSLRIGSREFFGLDSLFVLCNTENNVISDTQEKDRKVEFGRAW